MQVASSWISSTNLEEVVCTSTQCDSINTDIIFHEPDGNVLAEVPIRMEISITFLNHCSINHANILCNARNIEIYINDQYSETIRGDLQSNNIYSYSIQFKHSPTTELRLRVNLLYFNRLKS